MSSIDLFTMAIRNMTKRKLRSFLTILGVVVGSASIIVMISLGIATNINFEQSLIGMGDLTVINVMSPGSGGGGGMSFSNSGSSSSSLNYEVQLDEKAIKELGKLDDVLSVTPIVEFYTTAISGKFVNNPTIKGIDPASMEAFGFKLAEGRLLGEGENLTAVFGSQVSYNFYNPKDRNWWEKVYAKGYDNREPIINPMIDKVELTYDDSFLYTSDNPFMSEEEKKPKVKPYKLNVVGLLEEGGYENDYSIYMNIKDVEKIKKAKEKFESDSYGGNQRNRAKAGVYDKVMVKCKDINTVEDVTKNIEKLGYFADTPFKYISEMKETMASLQFLLGAVGGVAFFVAAIGIANTMIMAIYERTKEIGIMKVIGATVRDIKRLFLLEASLIGLIGGGLGVLLSYGISNIINKFGISFLGNMSAEGSKVSVIPPWLSIVALAFAATIGLLSGYFPARRAVKLNALTAIKSE